MDKAVKLVDTFLGLNVSQMAITLLIVIVLFAIFITYKLEIWNRFKFKKHSKVTNKNLDKHWLFTRLNYFIEFYIYNKINHKDELKEDLVRKALMIKFMNIFDAYKLEVKLSNKCKYCDRYTAYDRINFIKDIVTNYENDWKTIKIPKIFIHKFTEWHSGHIDVLTKQINYIWQTEWYSTYKERLFAEMSIMISVLEQTIMDMSITIDSLNGELSKELKKTKLKDIKILNEK